MIETQLSAQGSFSTAIISMFISSTHLLFTAGEEALRADRMSAKVFAWRESTRKQIKKGNDIHWMVITYVYPIVSARAISLIPEFLKRAEG